MDKNYTKYSHPANVVHVSSTFSGDMLKKYQYYNDLQTAVDEAPKNATVLCYDGFQLYTAVTGIKVVFIGTTSSTLVWEGRVSQAGTDPPTLLSTVRNDFPFGLDATAPFDYVSSGLYVIRFAENIASSAGLILIRATVMDSGQGFIMEQTGLSRKTIRLKTVSPDLSSGANPSDDLLSDSRVRIEVING